MKTDATLRANDIKAGARGGTLEIDTFVKTQDDTCVIVHSDDKGMTIHGSENATNKIHISYSAKDEHYDVCDAFGNKMNLQGEVGDCLFEALGHKMGKSTANVRTEVATKLIEDPLSSAESKI